MLYEGWWETHRLHVFILQMHLAVGLLWELSWGFRFWLFHGPFAKILSEAPSLLPAYLELVTGSFGSWWGLVGGQPGDPWELWEFCDCSKYCSPSGGCARAHLLTLGSRNSGHQRVMPSAHCTSPKPSLFIDSKTTGGREPLLDKVLEMPSWPLQPSVPSAYSWEIRDLACPQFFLRNAHANWAGVGCWLHTFLWYGLRCVPVGLSLSCPHPN